MKKITFLLITLLTINLIPAQTPGSESAITSIDAAIPYQGFGEAIAHIGTGEYKIYYDNIDGVLDQPIFFVDGFDPNDTRTIGNMYNLLDFGNSNENLADVLRNEGFDIVVLNFPTYVSSSDNTTEINGGADFIQRNAFIFTNLINTINTMKVGMEQNVIIGPSMGGLISRYALRYMEQNAMTHDTRLYISFDSPHLGANIPIGIQYLFNYVVNGDPGIPEARPLVDGLLNSAAAQQMLIDHYSSHVDASGIEQDNTVHTPKGAANYRNEFQAELDAMGFPQNTRNVTITNGSGIGAMTGTPGMALINHTFDTGPMSLPPFGDINTRVILNINFAPIASQNIKVIDLAGQANFITWFDVFSFKANAESTSFSDGLDSAPGGQFDLNVFDDNTNPLLTEFVQNLNSQYFNFIPTLSGLAISNETNWYANPNTNDSPFDNAYLPSDNEPHLTLTDGNVAFALEEIRGESLSINTNYIVKNEIRLKQNPIQEQVTFLSNKRFENANVSISDITGKVIFNKNMSIANHTAFPVYANSGLYILKIQTKDNYSLTKKLIIK